MFFYYYYLEPTINYQLISQQKHFRPEGVARSIKNDKK